MNAADASKLCAQNSAVLLNYQHPRSAFLRLRSGEEVLISVGTTSAKVFRRNPLFGWALPKRCVSKPLVAWEGRYAQFNNLHRAACRGIVLDGLLDLISRAESIGELCLAWPFIKNPLEVASVKLFHETFPDPNLPANPTRE